MEGKLPSFPILKRIFQFDNFLSKIQLICSVGVVRKEDDLKLYGVSVLFLQAPSHIASVLLVFTSRPEVCLNSLRSFKRLITD